MGVWHKRLDATQASSQRRTRRPGRLLGTTRPRRSRTSSRRYRIKRFLSTTRFFCIPSGGVQKLPWSAVAAHGHEMGIAFGAFWGGQNQRTGGACSRGGACGRDEAFVRGNGQGACGGAACGRVKPCTSWCGVRRTCGRRLPVPRTRTHLRERVLDVRDSAFQMRVVPRRASVRARHAPPRARWKAPSAASPRVWSGAQCRPRRIYPRSSPSAYGRGPHRWGTYGEDAPGAGGGGVGRRTPGGASSWSHKGSARAKGYGR